MKLRIPERRPRPRAVVAALCLALLVSMASNGYAVQRGLAPGEPPTPREMAPIDITGYWVAVITEDWRVRMITPPRGDFLSIPLNDAGIEMALAWDPQADIANGLECKAFGAAAIMRMPTRIHVTWEDDDTLRFDFDYGQMTRLAHFDASTPLGERSWQGQAVAEWINTEQGGGRGRGAGRADPSQRPGGLQMVTTNLLPQYQRQNGIPISEDAVVMNIIDLVPGPRGEDWLIVKTEIEDPKYLTATRVTSVQFKREPDDSEWDPQPCQVELPPVPRIPVQ